MKNQTMLPLVAAAGVLAVLAAVFRRPLFKRSRVVYRRCSEQRKLDRLAREYGDLHRAVHSKDAARF